jgi:hypothetical protein
LPPTTQFDRYHNAIRGSVAESGQISGVVFTHAAPAVERSFGMKTDITTHLAGVNDEGAIGLLRHGGGSQEQARE